MAVDGGRRGREGRKEIKEVNADKDGMVGEGEIDKEERR